MFNHNKSFWNKKNADAFVEYLKANGHADLQVWAERDRLNGCSVYIVKWN